MSSKTTTTTGWIKRKPTKNQSSPAANRTILEKWLNYSPDGSILESSTATTYHHTRTGNSEILVQSIVTTTTAKRKKRPAPVRRTKNSPKGSSTSGSPQLTQMFQKVILASQQSQSQNSTMTDSEATETETEVNRADGTTTFFQCSQLSLDKDNSLVKSSQESQPKSFQGSTETDLENSCSITSDEDVLPCTPPQVKQVGKRRRILNLIDRKREKEQGQNTGTNSDPTKDDPETDEFGSFFEPAQGPSISFFEPVSSISILSPIKSARPYAYFQPTIAHPDETYFVPSSQPETTIVETAPVALSPTSITFTSPVKQKQPDSPEIDIDETYFPGWRSFIHPVVQNDKHEILDLLSESDDAENIPCTPPSAKPKSFLKRNFQSQSNTKKEYAISGPSSAIRMISPRKPLVESPSKDNCNPILEFNTPKKRTVLRLSPKKQDLTIDAVENFNKLPSPVSKKYKSRPEKVRKKEERKKLPGWDCPECQAYFANFESQLNTQDIVRLRNKCSKHRAVEQKAEYMNNTPPFYWGTDMPNTEDLFNQGIFRTGIRSPNGKPNY